MAKAKNPHGGRRRNSGRKQSLSFAARMEIGSLCEAKWSAMSEAAAWSEYESQPHINDIREEQGRLNAIPLKLRSDQDFSSLGRQSAEDLTVMEKIDEVSQEIEVALKNNGAYRFSSIPLRRPQGEKDRLLQEVADSLGTVDGTPITKRMVKTCWDEFRTVQERIKLELS